MSFKYTLVVSQYYFSRYMKIVERPENFVEVARSFVKELEEYKRGEDYYTSIIRYGDLGEEYYKETSTRQNINDSGDIYFIHSNDIEQLHNEWNYYRNQTVNDLLNIDKRKKSFKKVMSDVANNHDEHKFYEIVNKHFDQKGGNESGI